MKQFKLWFLLCMVTGCTAACSGLRDPSQEVQAASGNGQSARATENRRILPDAPMLKNVASIRIGRYVDARMMGNPRKVGTAKVNAFGMIGNDIILDQEAAFMVTSTMKRRLQETGFKVVEERDANAQFELNGVVKELLFSVKARDEVSIEIETTLKNVATGRVVWSGMVVEKNDHFAGVPRVSKEDIASFLNVELDIVAAKTIESISDSLMISNPELFSPVTTVKPIPGVTVLIAPTAPDYEAADDAATIVVPPPVYKPSPKATSGMLVINTKPERAKVYIDGVYHGLTPFRLEMEAGLYAVSVKLGGYQMVAEQVMIRRRNVTEMDLTLER